MIVDQVDVKLGFAPLAGKPTIDEAKFALSMTVNGKATGPDDLPAERLKRSVREDPPIVQSFRGIVTAVWPQEEVRRRGSMPPSSFCTRTPHSAATTAAWPWWLMLVRCDSKWSLAASATIASRTSYSLRNSATSVLDHRSPTDETAGTRPGYHSTHVSFTCWRCITQ